jgi:1A family penicillin-binding protein
MKKSFFKKYKGVIKTLLFIFFIFVGSLILWVSSLDLPSLENFNERKVVQSTKIYDRKGETVLYDVHGDVKRTVVNFDQISDYVKKATVAVEDKGFYKHNGIQLSAVLRAVINNLKKGDLLGGQGGSTITQQVIKNALLTREKTLSRKIQEWVLAPKLEAHYSKDEILNIYLNEIPYGGNIYGVEEASRRFFGKSAKDITLAESAYLASLPQAPTYYSPYGNNIKNLEARKNYVLEQMKSVGYITEKEFDDAKKDIVEFKKQEEYGIKAPHFVMYIREQLEKEYGKEAVEQGGLKIITTLNYEMQSIAEEVVQKHAKENTEKHNATNAALVAIDPQTGELLSMVGSRNYFDEEIDGNFNITTALRQPGSALKPFVYATAFSKGYRPETVLFDVPTEFSTYCSSGGNCYSPKNYDGSYKGAVSMKSALAMSLNVPAVKTLYLAGVKESMTLATKMGITTLADPDRYGLTLVLGGAEVKPLDMALAYSVFANGGIKKDLISVLKIEDSSGKVIYEKKPEENVGERIIEENIANQINNILSDESARAPVFGLIPWMSVPGYQTAVKTGTTNDYKDAWIAGYNPALSVVAWAGNNNNSPMNQKVAGYIVTPLWQDFMIKVLPKVENKFFVPPTPLDENTKPVLSGFINEEPEIHEILHWVDKNNPTGPYPSNPAKDPQYWLWESPVQRWIENNGIGNYKQPNKNMGSNIKIIFPANGDSFNLTDIIEIEIQKQDVDIVSVFINNKKITESDSNFITVDLGDIKNPSSENILKIEGFDMDGKKYSSEINFKFNESSE